MTSASAEQIVASVVGALEPLADPERAAPMRRYMKDRCSFLGITTPERRAAVRGVLPPLRRLDPEVALRAAELLWERDEREYQYVGADLLTAVCPRLGPVLDRLEVLVRSRSWWDTVDTLASPVVGTVVRRHGLAERMDDWVDDADIWVARTAILHQLRFGEDVDEARLFAYCARRASDREFFIRKAIGWALRQHSAVAPDAVRAFVAAHPELSGLSRREALRRC